MSDSSAERGVSAVRGFTPRLVRDDDVASGPLAGTAMAACDPADGRPPSGPAVREVADSLAELFLGRDEPSASDGRPATAMLGGGAVRPGSAQAIPGARGVGRGGGGGAGRASVELLVLGHLPGLAGAWLAQYAAHTARTLGHPVALARLEPGGASVELFGLERGESIERAGSLAEAVRVAGERAGLWMLRVDELAEATLSESLRIGIVTLLTGVGEPSIVSAYRALKAIVQRRAGRGGEAGDGAGPDPGTGEDGVDLRIALLGASPERAREAAARVRKAAATFLGRGVGVLACAERLGPTDGRTIYRGSEECDAESLLGMIDRAPQGQARAVAMARAAAETDAAHPVGRPELEAGAGREAAAPRTSGVDQEDDAEWLLREIGEVEAAGGAREPGEGTAARPRTPVGKVTPPAPAPSEPGLSGGLARLVGLSTLPISCPEAARVELAMDGSGGLHLLVLDEMSVSTPGGSGRAGVAALLSAEAWARSNMDLICRALPGVRVGEMGLHLMTRIPASARDLLGTRVRVHLVVSAGGQDVCVGLN